MTSNSECNQTKEKWYYHEMIICTAIVLGIFGLIFLLINLGLDTKTSVEVGFSIFVGVILLPLIEPIRDIIKWLKKKRSNPQ